MCMLQRKTVTRTRLSDDLAVPLMPVWSSDVSPILTKPTMPVPSSSGISKEPFMPVWSADPSPLCTMLSPMMPECYGVADAVKYAIGCLNTSDCPDYGCISVPTECVPVVVSGSVQSLSDETKFSSVNVEASVLSGCISVPTECVPVVVSRSVQSLCVGGIDASSVNSAVDGHSGVQSVAGENLQNNRGRSRIRCEGNWKTNVRKRRRNSGLNYVDRRGQQKCARILKPGCGLKCNKKCTIVLRNNSVNPSFTVFGS